MSIIPKKDWVLCFFLLLIGITGCRSHQDRRIDDSVVPYSLENLEHVVPFHSPPPISFSKRFALVSYYHNLDCTTCVNRELGKIQAFYDTNKDVLDFMLVAYTPIPKGMSGNSDMRNLRRVGKVLYPMYTEHDKGLAQLGERFTIALLDTREQRIVLRYFPVTSEDHWAEFEARVKAVIQQQDPPPAPGS